MPTDYKDLTSVAGRICGEVTRAAAAAAAANVRRTRLGGAKEGREERKERKERGPGESDTEPVVMEPRADCK